MWDRKTKLLAFLTATQDGELSALVPVPGESQPIWKDVVAKLRSIPLSRIEPQWASPYPNTVLTTLHRLIARELYCKYLQGVKVFKNAKLK
jgi:hypothetical protein